MISLTARPQYAGQNDYEKLYDVLSPVLDSDHPLQVWIEHVMDRKILNDDATPLTGLAQMAENLNGYLLIARVYHKSFCRLGRKGAKPCNCGPRMVLRDHLGNMAVEQLRSLQALADSCFENEGEEEFLPTMQAHIYHDEWCTQIENQKCICKPEVVLEDPYNQMGAEKMEELQEEYDRLREAESDS